MKTKEEEKKYVDVIKEFSKNNEFKVYAFNLEKKGEREFYYRIYVDGKEKDYLKNKIQCKSDYEIFKSLSLGKIVIEFLPLDKVASTDIIEEYYVFCTKDTIDEFRELTIKEFLTSKPEEGVESNEFYKWVMLM
ncbi:MAG: hypothetical protein K6G88_13955 [Lachnospiraceae bacterium]|nr:hypothetical protein [Lachnospiraceae bacterium]